MSSVPAKNLLHVATFLGCALAACSGGSSKQEGPSSAGTAGSGNAAGDGAAGLGTGATGGSGGGTGGASSGSSGAGTAGTATGGSSSGGTAGSSMDAGASSMPAGSGGKATGGAGNAATGGGAGSGGNAGSGAGGSGGMAGEPDPVLGTQKEDALESLTAVRQEHAVAALAGEIYVIGGYVANTVSDSVIAYDPESDQWRNVKSLPGPIQHSNVGVVGEKLYVTGGYFTTGTTNTSSQVFEYDPMTDAWTEKNPMPVGTGRAAGCVAIDAGLMYVLGGAIDGNSVGDASAYDPVADEWDTLPPVPGRLEHCAAGALGGKIYFAGGRIDDIPNIQKDVWAYDPGAKTWTPVAPLLEPRAGLAHAVLGGKLFTFGGEGNPNSPIGIFDSIEVYDPVADEWEALEPMATPRHGFGAATLAGRIYLAGGAIREGGAASDENSVFYFE